MADEELIEETEETTEEIETVSLFSTDVNYNLIVRTSAEWSSENPIIPKGVLAWASDLSILKVGMGYLRWNDLGAANLGDGIEEAPNDDNKYARMNGKWCPIIGNIVTYPIYSVKNLPVEDEEETEETE